MDARCGPFASNTTLQTPHRTSPNLASHHRGTAPTDQIVGWLPTKTVPSRELDVISLSQPCAREDFCGRGRAVAKANRARKP